MVNKLKGVSLSIQTIVVVVIALLVLITVSFFFFSGFNPASSGIYSEADARKQCLEWMRDDFADSAYTNYPALDAVYGGKDEARKACTSGIYS
jgi:flagellar basal body-associated protein FliL